MAAHVLALGHSLGGPVLERRRRGGEDHAYSFVLASVTPWPTTTILVLHSKGPVLAVDGGTSALEDGPRGWPCTRMLVAAQRLAHRGSHTAFRRLRTPSYQVHRWRCSCPYAALGLQPGASAEEIKQQYLRLAKQVHPDVGRWCSGETSGGASGAGAAGEGDGSNQAGDREECGDRVGRGGSTRVVAGGMDMVRLNAAYEELTHPRRKEAAQTSAERRRDATAAAAALAAAGRIGQACTAFFSCDEESPRRGHAMDSGGSSAGRSRRETSGRDLFLAACAPGRDGPHGAATHAQLSELWLWLVERQLVDAGVCDGWFRACMRAGHTKAALEAYRLAEREGLEQGSQMRAYIRQVNSYKAAQAARAAGGGGGSG